MRLEMLAKDTTSGDQGCDSCYLGDDLAAYVQAQEASQEAYDAAINLLPGERPAGDPGRCGSHPGPRGVSMLPPGDPEFSAWFHRFQQSCFRLETLQHYGGSGEDDSIKAFLAGKNPQPHPGKREWTTLVRAAVADGRTMQRVHIVTEPLTPYACFEVAWSYAYSVAAGEDVRIIPVAEGESWPCGIPHPGNDFWLFDDIELFHMHYGPDGTWLGVERMSDPISIKAARHYRRGRR